MIYELLISLLAELFLEKKPAKDENRISQRRGENFFFGVKSRAIPSKQATRHANPLSLPEHEIFINSRARV
jgi:hypothetical protein